MTISNTDDVIDSRDVIERIEELTAELTERHEAGQFMSEFWDWIANSCDNSDSVYAAFGDEGREVQEQIEELRSLHRLAEDAEGSPDWEHGEVLIRRSHFVAYIEELIGDCYEMPKAMNSGEWPWRHMVMDYEAAASEAEADYLVAFVAHAVSAT
jgi:hypothetical protein